MTLFCHFNLRKVHYALSLSLSFSTYIRKFNIAHNIAERKLVCSDAVKARYLLLVQSLIIFFIATPENSLHLIASI